jgi:hypothetical protein
MTGTSSCGNGRRAATMAEKKTVHPSGSIEDAPGVERR